MVKWPLLSVLLPHIPLGGQLISTPSPQKARQTATPIADTQWEISGWLFTPVGLGSSSFLFLAQSPTLSLRLVKKQYKEKEDRNKQKKKENNKKWKKLF